jgi:hypothetical protein
MFNCSYAQSTSRRRKNDDFQTISTDKHMKNAQLSICEILLTFF